MTSEAAGSNPGPVRDSQEYYREGASWEEDKTRSLRTSASLGWIVATVNGVIALGAIASLVALTPLKKFEPVIIEVDKSSGYIEVKRPLADGPLQQDEAVTSANLVRYVRARETYDPKALKDNFDLAQLLSTGGASKDLTELFSPGNPKNLVKAHGTSTHISVDIKAVTFANPRTALVRFATDERSSTNVIHRDWVSLVRFQYSGSPLANGIRFENPLGFQVTEYRRDQETVPAVGAAGGSKP